MANINKIKLSGTTYNIQDLNAPKTVELTQTQYDALTVKDPNTFYVITDAQGADLSNYYTKSETSGATEISTALNAKQDTLVSGTNIKTINNESLLGSGNIDIQGGGGKTIVGGRGITVTSGETADTVSFNLALSAGTRTDSIIGGRSGNIATPQGSFAFGENNIISYDCAYASIFGYNNKTYNGSTGAHIVGVFNEAKNGAECAVGKNNVSNTGSTTADKTLFSVGNGTSNNARHNAFEIRQNGDIYISLNGQDVKLQDQLGGGGSSYTAGDGIDITNGVISVTGKTDTTTYNTYTAATNSRLSEDEEVTAAALNNINNRLSEDEEVTAARLNALNDAFGGLKLMKISQTGYDNLQVKDQNTLYIVI